MQVQVVERTQQIMLQEQEITRREKELEAKVKKPAEAERYRLEKLAEAQRSVSGFLLQSLMFSGSRRPLGLISALRPCVQSVCLSGRFLIY